MAIAITAMGVGLFSLGLSPFGESQILHKLALMLGYFSLFVAFEYLFVIALSYLNLSRTEKIVRIAYLIWIIPILVLFWFNAGTPEFDKHGLIFWNYRFPLNVNTFSFVFLGAIINFLAYFKASLDAKERLIKLRSLFLGLAFFFGGFGAFASFTRSSDYNYIFLYISDLGLALGLWALALTIYYKKAEVKKKLKVKN